MTDRPQLVVHRQASRQAAVIFIHGFSGDAASTWGAFPALLAAEPGLTNWDVYSVGYSTSLAFDIAGIWSADPELITLGGLLNTIANVPPLDRYQALAFVAHSMGGLLLQRALVTDRALRSRASHVLLFATPSAGLDRASPFSFWKRQVRDMASRSPFITALRSQWSAEIGNAPAFTFLAAGGDQDEFVPRSSSLDPFAPAQQAVVYGNHLTIVKPADAQHVGYKLAVKTISGIDRGDSSLPVDSARRAVELRDFQVAIESLWPHRQELDDQGAVTLALALESVGRQADAIEFLSSMIGGSGTDPIGVLAGRLKRRWLVEHRRADAERAMVLYREALEKSEAKSNAPQAFYHSINCAFMNLAYGGDATAGRDFANRALRHCSTAPADFWRYATEGEAHLYLGDAAAALDAYTRAASLSPKPRQLASTYQQAIRAADLVGEEQLGPQLSALFARPAAIS